jgi:hypothetical protein
MARKNHTIWQIGSDPAVACDWKDHWPLIVTSGYQDRATEAFALLQVDCAPARRQRRPGRPAGRKRRQSEYNLQ